MPFSLALLLHVHGTNLPGFAVAQWGWMAGNNDGLGVGLVIGLIAGIALMLMLAPGRAKSDRSKPSAKTPKAAAEEKGLLATRDSKAMFLAALSHEIRTPMSGIIAMIDLMEDTDLSAKQRDLIRVMRASSRALTTVTNEVLDFAQIETGRLALQPRAFDIVQEAETVLHLLADTAYAKGIDLFMHVDPDLMPFRVGDALRLRQVMINLVTHAIRVTDHGHVSLALFRSEKGRVRIEVRDMGQGLCPAHVAELNGDPHQKAAKAQGALITENFGDAGFGLALAQKLVRIMDGQLEATNLGPEEAGGTRFTISVPLARGSGTAISLPDLSGLKVLFEANNAESGQATRNIFERLGATLAEDPATADIMVVDISAHDIKAGLKWGQERAGASGLPTILLAPRRAALPTLQPPLTLATKPLELRPFLNRALTLAGREIDTDPKVKETLSLPVFAARTRAQAETDGTLILVAEDDDTNQIILGHILNALKLPFDLANNGERALELIKNGRYGLLLADYHMPRLNGASLAASVRATEESSAREGRMPIVALTADTRTDAEALLRDAGMDGFLAKPIRRDALAVQIARLVPAALAAAPNTPGTTPGTTTLGATESAAPVDADTSDEDLPNLDTRYLINAVGGDIATAAVVVHSLSDRIDALYAELQDAIHLNQSAPAFRAAHQIAGAAVSVGAERLALHAGRAKQAARSENMRQIADSLTPLRLAVGDFKAAAESFIAATENQHNAEEDGKG